MNLIIGLFALMFVPLIESQTLDIRDLSNDPVLLIKIRDCKIQIGNIKIIHPINITMLENSVYQFTKLAREIDKELPISKLILQRSSELVNNLHQLKPMKSRRTKRWDIIGTAWKWIAGSPDADDLKIINSTLNNLIEQNNQQLQVNNFINNRINNIATTVNKLIEQQSAENKLLLQEMDAVTLFLYMDNINNILEDLEDTILRTRIKVTNNKLLSLKNILTIEAILNEQGISTQFPEEALNFAEPKIVTRGDIWLYILQIPKVKGNCEVIQIIPLTVQRTILINLPTYVVRSEQDLFSTTNHDQVIQRSTFLEPLTDECTHHIIFGQVSHCNATVHNDTRIALITNNKILVNNAKHLQMRSNCGPHNRTLHGNFLITFTNCSIKIGNKMFAAEDIFDNTKELQGAFPNLELKFNMAKHHDITSIQNQTFQNRLSLEHIELRQFEHKNLLHITIGGLSTSMVMIIIITAICLYRKRVIINIGKQPEKPSQVIKQKPEDGL